MCNYPILGVVDLKNNITLKRMCERVREEEGGVVKEDRRKRIRIGNTIKKETIKAVAFEITNDKRFWFTNTLYKLEVDYKLPPNIMQAILSSNTFIGYVKEKGKYRKRANLFTLDGMIKPTYNGVLILARCKEMINISDMQVMDLKESEEFVERHNLYGLKDLKVNYATCEKIVPFITELDDEEEKMVKEIDSKVIHFLKALKQNNPRTYEMLTVRLQFRVTNNKLNYKLEEHGFAYFYFLSALLNLSKDKLEKIYMSDNYSLIIKILYQYLQLTQPDSDPIFVFNHSGTANDTQYIVYILIAIAVFVLFNSFR